MGDPFPLIEQETMIYNSFNDQPVECAALF